MTCISFIAISCILAKSKIVIEKKMNNLKVLPYISSVKPAPYSYSLSFQSYGPNCIVDLESFESGEFSEFFNTVKTLQLVDTTTSSLIYVVEES